MSDNKAAPPMTPDDAMQHACKAGDLDAIKAAAAKGGNAYTTHALILLAVRGGPELGEAVEWIANDHTARGLVPGPLAGIYPRDYEDSSAANPDAGKPDPLIHYGCLAADARAIRAMAQISHAGGVAPGELISTCGAWGLTGTDYLMYGQDETKHRPAQIRSAMQAVLEVGAEQLDSDERERVTSAIEKLTTPARDADEVLRSFVNPDLPQPQGNPEPGNGPERESQYAHQERARPSPKQTSGPRAPGGPEPRPAADEVAPRTHASDRGRSRDPLRTTTRRQSKPSRTPDSKIGR